MTVNIYFHSKAQEKKALYLISIRDIFEDFGGGKRYIYTVDESQLEILKEHGIKYVEWVH